MVFRKSGDWKKRRFLERDRREYNIKKGDKSTKIGDKVIMNNKYYVSKANQGKIWRVRSEPWECCGQTVVLLEGKSSGYAVDGLDVVETAGDETDTVKRSL